MTSRDLDDIDCRQAVPADALCLGVLATQVFLDNYATQGIRASIAREVLAECSIASFEALLAETGATIWLAERVGHLVGFAQIEEGAGHPLVADHAASELRRLYVQERSTGRGIGRLLLGRAERAAAARGAQALWLTAWCGNARALQFYPRCGYEDLGPTVFTFEDEHHPNRLFRKRLPDSAGARA